MPADRLDLEPFAELIETAKLVVYQRFQGADIEDGEPTFRPIGHSGQYRQECGFGLAGSRGRSDQDITLTSKDCRDGPILDVTKLLPLLLPYPSSDFRMQPVETGQDLRA